MDLDAVLSDVGEFGPYQKMILWFILLPGVFPCGFHAYNQLFMTGEADHWCKIPESTEQTVTNMSDLVSKINHSMQPSNKCFMYEDLTNSSVNEHRTFCEHGWIYDRSQYLQTVVMEWDLVCNRDFLPTIALVLFGFSGLVGSCIFGYLQDGLGRKPSFFIYLLIQCVFGIATAFAHNFSQWVAFRIGVGFTIPAILGTPTVLAIELVGPHYRTLVTVLTNIAYSLSLISLAIIVWLIRDWRILALATTIPFIILFVLYPLLPESPRWLLSQERFDETENIINKIARINGVKLPQSYIMQLRRAFDQIRSEEKSQTTYGLKDLFRTPNLRMKTIIITFIWFTNTSVYVGLSYYAPILGGDEFLNFFLAGAVELPTYLVLWPAMEYWGRRWILCISMTIGGVACLATFLVENDSVVTLTLYCIGKMGISSSFVVLPLMASELYPTVVRGLGMSISSVMGMLGPVFIPLINYLGSDMLTLPLIIMGVLLVIGGACSLLLPETLNQHLPETLEDGEKSGLNCFACYSTSPTNRTVEAVYESAV